MERAVVAIAFGQERVMHPDPQVAEHQRHRNEQQPQAGLAGAGVNPGLPQLAKARFDAEPLSVTLATISVGDPLTRQAANSSFCFTCLPSLRFLCVR